jgi:hypothetical protein
VHAVLRRFAAQFANFRSLTARDLHAQMASILKEKSGTWRVQVRRKGRCISETFIRYDDAKKWGIDAERQIDRGETPTLSRVGKLQTFADLIDLPAAYLA